MDVLERQDVLDQSGDVLRYPGVVPLHGRPPGLQGRHRDEVVVVPMIRGDRRRTGHRFGVDEGVVDLGEVVERLDRRLQLRRQLVVGHEVQHLQPPQRHRAFVLL